MASFKAFLNSPVGPKTTHFWGPVANWGFVIAVRSSTRMTNIQFGLELHSYRIVLIGIHFAGASRHAKTSGIDIWQHDWRFGVGFHILIML